MALPLVLCRMFYKWWSNTTSISISRISPSDDWSTINLVLPKEIIAAECDISCSGNGWLCFYRRRDGDFVIWNLSSDTCQFIPHSELIYHPCVCSSALCVKEIPHAGTGFGLVADGFKLVTFMYIFNSYGGRIHNSSCHLAIYSSKNNSWKDQSFPFSFHDEYDISPRGDIQAATCLNGFLYWTTFVDAILSFELSSDSFSTIPFPDDIKRDFWPQHASLLELDGSLGLGIRFELGNTLLFSFWVYGGGSRSSPWTRKLNLDVCDASISVIRPLWLGKRSNGEYSLLALGYHGPELEDEYGDYTRREGLLEYDYSTREVKKIDLIDDDHPDHNRMMISSLYVEAETDITIGSVANVTVDRISPLPDDIILSILSFLSLKEAAASTSLLSKRWSDLWRQTPNLNFHFAHHLLSRDKHKYIECVNSVVESYRALALKELNVSIPLNYNTRRTVTKWLEFAFSRRVEVLELNFLGSISALVDILLRVFKSTNLRSLCLKCLQVGGDAIGLLLRNCPMLERLIIKHAVFTSDVEVYGRALKHLDIHCCKGSVSIKGYAPNLSHLKIDSGPIMSIHVPPRFDYPELEYWAHPFISSQLTTLEFILEGYLEKGFPEMPSLRVLRVTYYKQQHGISPITCLLRAVPYLEEFEIKHGRSIIEEQQQGMEMEGVKNVCHRHLRVFKFTWFDVSNGNHMELMSYILKNCIALHKIIHDMYDADHSPRTFPACAAAMEYAKLLRSKLPTHIQFIVTFNCRQLLV